MTENVETADPIYSQRRVQTLVTLTGNDYRHTHGDQDMWTQPDRRTLVVERITLTPKRRDQNGEWQEDWQQPTDFEAKIYSRHRERGGDETEFTANNIIRMIPIVLEPNEFFHAFQGNVRDYSYTQRIRGRHHGWVSITPADFVTSAAVHYDGRTAHDRTRQGFRASLLIHYTIAYYPNTPEGEPLEGLDVRSGEEMP